MNGPFRAYPKHMTALLAIIGVLASVASAAPITLTNGVPVTGLAGTSGSETFYAITVPSGQDDLEISISGGTGDCDLYVRRGATPTTTSYDYRPYKSGNNETVAVESPAAGTWYIMLRGYTAYSGVTLVATYSADTTIVALANGVSVTGLAGSSGGELYFSIEVPASQSKLQIAISGGTGDCDLYVKRGALPTTSDYDYRPFLGSNEESVSVTTPAAGTWYIMLRGYTAYTGVTLLATYGGGVGSVLENGVPVTGLAGTQASEKIFRIEIPAGQSALDITIAGGTGDCDLYVKFGDQPTTSSYDYRPFLSGNDETVNIPGPTGGTWYIMLRGYSSYSGVTLTASYGDVIALEDNVPIVGLSGAVSTTMYYKIVVPSGKTTLEVTISGGTGNCDLYVRHGAKPTVSTWDYRPYLSGNNETVTVSNPDSGTWYIMLRARQAYSGVTLNADYWFTGSVTLLDNGVPVTGIADSEGGEKYYRLIVPSGQDTLEFSISGGTGDADLYVKLGSLPTTTDYDYRPYEIGNEETITIDSPTSGNWLIMIRGYHAYSGLTLVATYGTSGHTPTVTTLTNGVAVTGLSGALGSETYYKIDVPSGQASLEIAMSGGSGDADMYIRRDSKPTTTEWDYRPFLAGNYETVSITNPTGGTYYIMLRGDSAYSGVSLIATYTPVHDTVTTLTNGVPVTSLSAAAGNETYYKIVVPSGQDYLEIAISGGSGDCDLYVKKGAKPTTLSYDYRPYLLGNDETVEVTNPASATWYIMLRAYQAYSGLTLVATYGSATVGNDFTADPACVALWRFEPGDPTADSIGSNTLEIANSADVDTVDYMEGEGAGDTQSGYFRMDDADLDSGFPLKSGETTTAMSVAFWVKAYWGSSQATGASMFAKGAETGPRAYSFAIGLHESAGAGTGTIRLNVGTSDGTNLFIYDAGLSKVFQRDQWYHLAVTYQQQTSSSGTLKVYLYDPSDDTVTTSTVASAVMPVFDGPLALGALRWSTARFGGLIDEFAVFNDVLTSSEINQIRQGSYGKP